ncbi:MAG TPA: SurA N-terminal domain-containing protein, partial [Arenicellales bacterium]|nr:SurA N-terminal domain-containing protein [Arenicellales bacterium]
MTHLWTYRAFLPFVLAVGLFSLALFAVTSISGAESAQSIDRVLVIVNQEVITEFELEKEMQLVQGELRASGQAIASPDTLRAKILEDMILARIQLQVAKDRGIRASEAMLDAAFADIARRNRLSPDRLR